MKITRFFYYLILLQYRCNTNNQMILNKFTDFYKRFERYISPIGLIYGFIFTSLTLTRVDMWLENFWIVMHLLIVCFGILAQAFYENRLERKGTPEADRTKFHFYLTLVIQFAFGGLFSTFFVFYMRSTSITESWIFVLILLILLIGNELWKKYYQRLAFQVSVLFISIYLFLIFLLPVLLHRLGADIFIISGILSLVTIFFFLRILRRFTETRFKSEHNILRVSVITIYIIMNALYFTDIIPPIPLSLKVAGVYHNIVKTSEGNYQAVGEPTVWQDYFNRYPVFHYQAGETVYAFSSIFSPIAFITEIVHQWQYYDENTKTWVDSGRITLPISGGREQGFRTYSIKQSLAAGFWRVRVMTPAGQVLGNIKFEVIKVPDSPSLITKIL